MNKYITHLSRVSSNSKVGPIPVSTTESATCPPSCPFFDAGCYAKTGPVSWHWNKVSSGLRGDTFNEFLNKIKEHKKDVGVISDVVGFIYSGDSYMISYPVEIKILAVMGDIAMLSFVVPKLTSKNNQYISAPINVIGLPDNKDTEALGISTPKVIFEIFEEENLQNQANEILNQLTEKKELDELFK